MELMTIAERLAYLFELSKVVPKNLLKEIPQSEKTMYNYLSGSTIPSADFLSIVVAYTKCNGHWLLTGTGNIFSEGENATSVPTENKNTDNNNNNMAVPMDLIECKKQLRLLTLELSYLKQQVKDKDTIIALLKQNLK